MTSTVRIVERTNHLGWRIHWSPGCAEDHETAIAALTAVKDRDKLLVNSGHAAVVTTVEWEPSSRVGKAVVAAIVNARG